ncbi:MAG: hypothetical protein ACT4PT_06275, partial [Methanobacteriota archaeon]
TKTANGWSIEIVDHAADASGLSTSIKVDVHDRPRISYIMWSFNKDASCADPLNRCFDLRYAEPAVSVLGAAGN